MEIFQEKYQNKRSTNTSSASHVNLANSHKLLQQGTYDEWVSSNDIYNEERNACNNIRLTCQINIIASNVLHNNVTEIVKNEGSEGVVCLNYESNKISETVCTSVELWTQTDAIRDTQISNNKCGYVYHPGKDIFNNHLLRSTTFKPIVYNTGDTTAEFNTIADALRQESIDKSSTSSDTLEYITYPVTANFKDNTREIATSHLYTHDTLLTYKNALNQKLIRNYSGWYGFKNAAKMSTYEGFNSNSETRLEINKPINSANAGDFIDMYPSRDLYSFCPKYNKYRHRLEKNWNYILTYPSSSTTDMYFIDSSKNENTGLPNNGLKAYAIDENTVSDNGTKQLVIYSISKHGLQEGDYVNIYYSNNDIAHILLTSVEVITVVDEYIFAVFADGEQISDEWVDVSDVDGDTITVNERSYNIKTYGLEEGVGGPVYPLVNTYANVDKEKQHISYKKVNGKIEYDYYVRIFSKLPNFKYATSEVNEYELYKEGSTLISECQTTNNEFENHVSRLAFSKNVYGDDIGQIVFTDNIRFDLLKDNLGRPLTSIYLTLLKNNKGYKEWYGKNGSKGIDIANENVEFSHCFGKLNCGFIESYDEIYCQDAKDVNIRCMTNVSMRASVTQHNTSGLSISAINDSRNDSLDEDEIDYSTDTNFYGDLVMYDSANCNETTIQYIMHRFNTAQRELKNSDKSYSAFSGTNIDVLVYDDYDGIANGDDDVIHPFSATGEAIQKYFELDDDDVLCQRPEGYFYCPHYQIPIRTFSELKSLYPSFFTLKSLIYDSFTKTWSISIMEQHFLGISDKVILYDSDYKTQFYGLVTEIGNRKCFKCKFYRQDNTEADISIDHLPYTLYSQDDDGRYKMFKVGSLDIPNYAQLLRDGSCRYIWREVLQNGEDSEDAIEQYPFTNNSLYVNLAVNLHLRRQDPYGESDLWKNTNPQDPVKVYVSNENNYIEEDDIKC